MSADDLFLEDEVDEQEPEYRPNLDDEDLFGDGAEEQQQQEDDAVREPSPPRLSAAEIRKQQLKALAAKQRDGGDEDGGKARKKQKMDKKDKKPKDGSSRRDKRGAAADDDEAAGDEEAAGDAAADGDYRAEELFGEEEENEDAALETDADRAFIDDDGAAPASDGDDDDDIAAGEQRHLEAEEGELDDIDMLIKQRKRRRGPDDQQITQMVTSMVARMEFAAEEDTKAQSNGKPAIQKLRLVREVEQFMANRLLHEELLASNGLHALSQWIAPYEDGSLPNTKVRETVLRCLKLLPINTMFQNHQEMLKESRLGRHVMLLMKLPDETLENKKRAKELVEAWSRPIFADSQAEEEKKKLKARELERARVMNKAISQEQDEKLAAMMAGVKRVHAMIPQSSKLDYVNEPQSMVEAERGQGGGRVSGGILEKKGREILRRSKQTSDRAMKPSIEGRGMVLYK